MYNINYFTDLGTHWMTVTHKHYSSIYENQDKIKFNFVKAGDKNSKFDNYIKSYIKTAKKIGCTEDDINFFIKCIHPNCSRQPNGFGFSPTHPYIGPENFVVNLEHYSSLFTYLYINSNKDTSEVNIQETCWPKLMSAVFLQENFRGILSHIHDTIDTFKILTRDFPEIHNKFIYFPLASPEAHVDIQPKKYKNILNIIFTNSYGGQLPNFRLRGGIESINATISLLEKYNNLYLTTIGPSPTINHPQVKQYHYHIEDELFNKIVNEGHIFLIPGMRIHSISIVKALCNGLIPIVSDGWAFDEYITDKENGLIAQGQYGFTSWKNKDNLLIEAYGNNASPKLTDNIKNNLIFLLENPDIYNEMSENCIKYAKENFNIDRRNKILEEVVKNAQS